MFFLIARVNDDRFDSVLTEELPISLVNSQGGDEDINLIPRAQNEIAALPLFAAVSQNDQPVSLPYQPLFGADQQRVGLRHPVFADSQKRTMTTPCAENWPGFMHNGP